MDTIIADILSVENILSAEDMGTFTVSDNCSVITKTPYIKKPVITVETLLELRFPAMMNCTNQISILDYADRQSGFSTTYIELVKGDSWDHLKDCIVMEFFENDHFGFAILINWDDEIY